MVLTPEQLLERCNEIRRAGGAEEITELLPGVKDSATHCLIARNVNFDCHVQPHGKKSSGRYTYSGDERFAQVAEALGWSPHVISGRFVLPDDLCDTGVAFDAAEFDEGLYTTIDAVWGESG